MKKLTSHELEMLLQREPVAIAEAVSHLAETVLDDDRQLAELIPLPLNGIHSAASPPAKRFASVAYAALVFDSADSFKLLNDPYQREAYRKKLSAVCEYLNVDSIDIQWTLSHMGRLRSALVVNPDSGSAGGAVY